MELEQIKEEIERRAEALESTLEIFHSDLVEKLKAAQDNAILTAIGRVNARLDAIEARLPEPEDDEN